MKALILHSNEVDTKDEYLNMHHACFPFSTRAKPTLSSTNHNGALISFSCPSYWPSPSAYPAPPCYDFCVACLSVENMSADVLIFSIKSL